LNPALDLAALLVAPTGFALYLLVDAVRWRRRRQVWIALASILPLGVAASMAFLIGTQNPTANFWGNLGLGPDWDCRNEVGGRGGQACLRDVPAGLQGKPSALPSAK
jgi:hypothetical protein